MNIFDTIMNKIFHHPAALQSDRNVGHPPSDLSSSSAASTLIATAETIASDMMPSLPPSTTTSPPQVAGASSGIPAKLDVGAVLGMIAHEKGGGGDYQHSIVDLLQLLEMDSSLEARTQLAQELNIHAGADGSAEQNIALHKAVTQKLAENGGHLSDSMRV